MNKEERDKWREALKRHPTLALRSDVVLPLLDYVDTLEAALAWYRDCCECERVYGRQAREALDKGK